MPSYASIIGNAQENTAVFVPNPNTFFFTTTDRYNQRKIFTIELANLVKSEVGCPDIELVSILNSADNSAIDSTVFTVNLAATTMTDPDDPDGETVDVAAATMIARTGDYTKAVDYSMKVIVKYTGAAYTNTFEFILTGEI